MKENVWKNLIFLLQRAQLHFIAALGCMLLVGVLQIPTPLLTMRAIDEVTKTTPNLRFVHILSLLLILSFALTLGVRAVQRNIVEKLRTKLVFWIQRQVFSSGLRLPLEYYASRSHGYMMARVNEDPYRLESLIGDSALSIAGDIITLLIGISFLLCVHWKLALVSFSVLPVLTILVWKLRNGLRSEFSILQEQSAQVSSYLGDCLSNLFSIKTLSVEQQMTFRYSKLVAKTIRQRFVILRKRLIYESLISAATGLIPIFVLWYGVLEIAKGHLTVGQLVGFSGYLAYLYRPVESITISFLGIQNSIAAAERVIEIVQLPSEQFRSEWILPESNMGAQKVFPEVQFKDVSFRYPGKQNWALENVCCTISTGKLTAIVGSSGSGKTTLVNLIPQLLHPEKGSVTIRGIYADTLPALRRQIAIVNQETLLFDSTISDNILFGSHAVTEADVMAAAVVSCADEFIRQLPAKYNTRVGEGGRALSAGQRQRILIARAIACQPMILILDEATSCLDLQLERQLLQRIKYSSSIQKVIMVTHRDTVTQFADQVLRVERGVVKEEHLCRSAIGAQLTASTMLMTGVELED